MSDLLSAEEIERIEKANLANILKRLKAGKTLTSQEKAFLDSHKPKAEEAGGAGSSDIDLSLDALARAWDISRFQAMKLQKDGVDLADPDAAHSDVKARFSQTKSIATIKKKLGLETDAAAFDEPAPRLLSVGDLEETWIPKNALVTWLGQDPRTLSELVGKESVPTDEGGNYQLWPLMIALFEKQKKTARSTSDMRNLSAMRKTDVETAALLKELVPVGEVMVVFSRILNLLGSAIRDSDLSNTEKDDLTASLRDIMESKDPDWLSEFSTDAGSK